MKRVKLFDAYHTSNIESNVNEGKVKVFLDKIVSRMVEKGLGVHYDHRMRQEIKDKIEDAVKETMEKYDYIVESKKSEALAKAMDNAMIKIDDSMSYEDFALAVGKILKEEYGSHNYKKFMEVLHKDLGI